MKVLDHLPLYAGVLLLQLVAVVSVAFGRLPEAWAWPFLLAWGAALATAIVIGYRSRYRSAVAGELAQLAPLAIAGVLLGTWYAIAGLRFPFIACALALLVGRNTMLATRRNLYIDLAIVLALFYDALGTQRGGVLVAFEIAFLAALVFVLMADYADRRLAYAQANEEQMRSALLPALGNAALSTVLVLAVAAAIYLLLPKPASIGLDFPAPDALPPIESANAPGRPGPDGDSRASPGAGSGPREAPAPGPRRLSLAGAEAGAADGGAEDEAAAGAGDGAAGGDPDRNPAVSGGGAVLADRVLARIGVPLFLATVDAPQPHYARASVYAVPSVSAWSESAEPPATRFGSGSFELRPQGPESAGLVQTWTLRRGLGRNIPAALQPVYLQLPALAVEVHAGQMLAAKSRLWPGLRYRVVSSIGFSEGRPAGAVEVSPAGRDAALPEGYARVRGLAAQLAAGPPGDIARAEAIEAYLRRNYVHGSFPAAADNPVDAFLFERRAGAAPQFAAALASLLRAAGIDSRIVAGFRVRRFNPLRGEFEIWETDRHVWVEAWLDSRWRTFDAAPWATIPGDAPVPGAWDAALDYVRLARHDDFGVPVPAGQRPADWYLALVLAWGWAVSFGPWLLLAIVGSGLLVWWARRALRPVFDAIDLLRLRCAGGEPRRTTLAAFDAVERVFARRGMPRRAQENHGEYLQRLGLDAPVLASRLATLGGCFSAARYGPRCEPETDRLAASACRDIVRLVDERLA